ncbi:MAG: hypothetical protein U0694_04315 [Anaerolineae bacterium]
MNSNWFDHDASRAHQNELLQAAAQERLAQQIGERSQIVRVYDAAMASLGRRMILWGTTLQKRAGQPVVTPRKAKAA